MPSLGTMKARIAGELGRTALSAEIASAITSAISFYDGTPFYFNEAKATFSTVSGQDTYSTTDWADLANVMQIFGMRCQLSNRWFVMKASTWGELQLMSSGITQNADPTNYAYFAQQLRVYPIPSAVRTLEVTYLRQLGVPASDSASNGWTNEAEELIRTHAKIDLLENIIREDAGYSEAGRMRLREKDILDQLRGLSLQLTGTGRVRAWYL